MTVPASTVTLTPLGGAGVDVSCDVADVTINHGRSNPDSQPDASTATLSLPLGMAAGVEIGAAVKVTTALSYVRFVGTVTDMAVEWRLGYDAANDDPAAVIPMAIIIAAGPLADIGRRYFGDVPWPQEPDGTRVARILAAVADPSIIGTVDPGTVDVLPRDVDRQPALALSQEVAQDASGIVWQTRDGKLCYADAEHRRNTAAAVTLDACDVVMSPRWVRNRSGLINDVALAYGEAPEGGEQPVTTATSPDSITRFGRVAYSVTTQLAELADADAMAQLLMTRNAYPVWLLEAIGLDLAILDPAKSSAILGLDMHALVNVTGFPRGGPATSAALWTEGWTEDIGYGRHAMSLFVSGYCRTTPPPRWDDLASTTTWDKMDPAIVWDTAYCFGPIVGEGRWNDVASTLRWDEVAASVTWDTWKG